MNSDRQPRIARLADAEAVPFGPLSQYRRLLGEPGLPLFTGVQSCAPGYATAPHWHPYVEYLFVVEGVAEAWLHGREDEAARLAAGDIIALPAGVPHGFRNPGPGILRVLGIHCSPTRIVHRLDAPSEAAVPPAPIGDTPDPKGLSRP